MEGPPWLCSASFLSPFLRFRYRVSRWQAQKAAATAVAMGVVTVGATVTAGEGTRISAVITAGPGLLLRR